MMKASPAAAFIVAKADLLLEFLIIPLDAPAQFSGIDEMLERDVSGKSG